MKAVLTLECNCGNSMVYSAKNKYHEDTHAVYVDLTEEIYGNHFTAKLIPTGTWVNCEKCKNGFEIA